MTDDIRPCAVPDCEEPGEYPAPRDPRRIYERQFMCLKHIKEFNAKWNGLNGFSEKEIFSMQHGGATWDRPTWKLGVNSKSETAAKAAYGNYGDAYELFEKSHKRDIPVTPDAANLPPAVRDACAELGLEPPLNEQKVRKRYHKLAKEHHPDRNKSPESADKIKSVNTAYRTLLQHLRGEDETPTNKKGSA